MGVCVCVCLTPTPRHELETRSIQELETRSIQHLDAQTAGELNRELTVAPFFHIKEFRFIQNFNISNPITTIFPSLTSEWKL